MHPDMTGTRFIIKLLQKNNNSDNKTNELFSVVLAWCQILGVH